MALDGNFVGLVKACFDEHGNILAWLEDEGIRTAEDTSRCQQRRLQRTRTG